MDIGYYHLLTIVITAGVNTHGHVFVGVPVFNSLLLLRAHVTTLGPPDIAG